MAGRVNDLNDREPIDVKIRPNKTPALQAILSVKRRCSEHFFIKYQQLDIRKLLPALYHPSQCRGYPVMG